MSTAAPKTEHNDYWSKYQSEPTILTWGYRALGKIICPLCEQVAYLHTPRMCERCYQYMARRGVAHPEAVQAAEDALNAYWWDRYLWPHVLALLLATRVWPPRHLVAHRELHYVA